MFDELRALLDGVPVMQGIAAATGLSIASLIAGVLGKIFGGGDTSAFAPTTAEQRALQQSMVELIEQQRGYMSEQDPLRAAVNRMAMGMLPIRYQTGLDYRTPSAPLETGTEMPQEGSRNRGDRDVVDIAVP